MLAPCASSRSAAALQARSGNRALIESAARLAPAGITVVPFEGLRALPQFDPDLEATGAPEPVQALRRALADSDALLIACPEYGHSLPGVVKNMAASAWWSALGGAALLSGALAPAAACSGPSCVEPSSCPDAGSRAREPPRGAVLAAVALGLRRQRRGAGFGRERRRAVRSARGRDRCGGRPFRARRVRRALDAGVGRQPRSTRVSGSCRRPSCNRGALRGLGLAAAMAWRAFLPRAPWRERRRGAGWGFGYHPAFGRRPRPSRSST